MNVEVRMYCEGRWSEKLEKFLSARCPDKITVDMYKNLSPEEIQDVMNKTYGIPYRAYRCSKCDAPMARCVIVTPNSVVY